MRLLLFAELVLRRWWLLVVLPLVGLAAAYIWSANTPKQYESTVTLQLNPSAKSALLPYVGDPRGGDPSGVTTLAASYAEVLRSRSFGEFVIATLDLNTTPDILSRNVSARLIPNTNIMRVAVSWNDREDAQRLVQGIADLFISVNLRAQQTDAGTQSGLSEMEDTARNYVSRIQALRPQRDELADIVAKGGLDRLTELDTVEGRLTALQTNYTNLLVEINRTRSTFDTASILDSASEAKPVGPMPLTQALLMGLLGGLALALGLAFFLEELDDTVRTPEDVMAVTDSAPIAAVGRIHTKRGDRSRPGARLVALQSSRSANAEAFLTLRTNLRFALMDQPIQSLVITSAGPSEGKTLVASNLAITLAQTGQQVLLVDADLRRPSIHKVFALSNDVGLTDLLIQCPSALGIGGLSSTLNAVAIGDVGQGIVKSEVENLWLLPSGNVPHNPSTLLGSNAFGALIERLTKQWDMVIVDTAPIGPVADTLLVAMQVSAVLTVSRAGRSRRGSLRSALESLRQTGRPVLGVILNDFRFGPLSRYTSASGYYYNYNKHYYTETEGGRGGEASANGNSAQTRVRSALKASAGDAPSETYRE